MNLRKAGVTLAIDSRGRYAMTVHDGKLGWRDMALGVRTSTGESFLDKASVRKAANGTVVLRGEHPALGLAEETHFELLPGQALAVSRALTRTASGSVTVMAAMAGRLGGQGGPVFADNDLFRSRFAHMDNLRTECYPWSRPEAPYVRALPRTPTWFGDQESVALPSILYTNDTYGEMLIEGQLAQDVSRMRWRLSAGPEAIFAEHAIEWDLYSGGILLQQGECLRLEPLYHQILGPGHPQHAFSGYLDEVVRRNRFRQERNCLHHEAMYCNYNYGVYMDFDAKALLRRADIVARHLPGIRHYLLDCGWYEAAAPGWPDTAFFLDRPLYDRRKFPRGLKVFADQLKRRGLKPSIWWTPTVDLHSGLARKHPEWLAKDATGAPYRIGPAGYLDYGHPQARDFLQDCFRTIFGDWGYQGMKIDFWCQSVESRILRYSAGHGLQWRDWLLGTIRDHLPEDGFLMTCVAMAMGNPFLGKHAHTYRCCNDVGAASWREHVNASIWIQPLLSLGGRRTCLLNVDGIGVNPELTDAENLHRLTYGFITMGSLEIDGKMELLRPDQMDWLRRVTTDIDRGHQVVCPDDDCYTGRPLPKALCVDYPEDSLTRRRGIRKHIALFNWDDRPRYVGYPAEQLGLSGTTTVRDFWTGAERTLPAGDLCERLDGRSARLYEVGG